MVIKLLSLIVISTSLNIILFPSALTSTPQLQRLHISGKLSKTHTLQSLSVSSTHIAVIWKWLRRLIFIFSPISGVNLGLIIFPALQFFNRFPRLAYFQNIVGTLIGNQRHDGKTGTVARLLGRGKLYIQIKDNALTKSPFR